MLQDIYQDGNTSCQVEIRNKIANQIGNYSATKYLLAIEFYTYVLFEWHDILLH